MVSQIFSVRAVKIVKSLYARYENIPVQKISTQMITMTLLRDFKDFSNLCYGGREVCSN